MAWIIIPLDIKVKEQVICLNQKLPPYYANCEGIIYSYRQKSPEDFTPKGVLSLSFNSQQIHPIHIDCEYNKHVLDNHNNYFPLGNALLSNTFLTGYYADKSIVERRFYGYRFQIYLNVFK